MASTFPDGFARIPIVAILRGLSVAEAPMVAAILNEAGICAAEVPLNRPDALDALRALAEAAPPTMMVGCGTAVRVDDVHAAREAGARFVVSPNADPAVIRAAKAADLLSCPGFQTMSEGYAAILAGADYLKLFPCSHVAPATLKTMIAALPADPPPILCVGGIDATNMQDWRDAGAAGFGLGGSLFRPGMTPDDFRAAAKRATECFG